MKKIKNTSLLILAFQLVVDVCHLSIHHFALGLLWTKNGHPSALGELLIYAGGLSCMAFVGNIGSQLQSKQESEDLTSPNADEGNGGGVLLILVSFAAGGLTLYLLQ